jgi:nucleotide-binding universal stress UspA family protein
MRRILLALDARGHADQAAAVVRTWISQDRVLQVVMLYVTEVIRGRFPGPRLPMSYEREVAQAIDERMMTDVFGTFSSRVQFIHRSGFSVSQVICLTAQELNCDMIVLGGEPPHGIWRWLGYHIPQEVLKQSVASVVVIRPTIPRRVEPLSWRAKPHRAG